MEEKEAERLEQKGMEKGWTEGMRVRRGEGDQEWGDKT